MNAVTTSFFWNLPKIITLSSRYTAVFIGSDKQESKNLDALFRIILMIGTDTLTTPERWSNKLQQKMLIGSLVG